MALIRSCIRRFFTTTTLAIAPQNHAYTQFNMLEINSQLRELVKSGQLNNARKLFDKLPHKDEVSWTTIISGYVHASDSSEALSLFSTMWVDPSLHMDPFILSLALKACGLNMNPKCGESLHGYSVKSGLVNSIFVGSSILDMYMKMGKISEGCLVFDEMPSRNVVSWTAIITGLVRSGNCKEGLVYFSQMWKDNVEYDSYTFAIALKACADMGLLNHGREIHTLTIKKGVDITSYVANTLATMYNKCGKLKYGLYIFKNMSNPDVVSWTNIITSYVQMNDEQQIIKTFLQMRNANVNPNDYTFAAVIAACANFTRHDWGEQLHAHVLQIGHDHSLSVANSIMTMYSKCGQINSASKIFYSMSKPDIVSWSTIISGYTQNGYCEEAFELLSHMRNKGPKPTEFAYSSVLSLCGSIAILDQGKQIHSLVLIIGLDHTAMIRSALINMYSKCGSIGEASKIFNESKNNDIISWTALINGYAEHGFSREAIDLFEKIPEAGLRPDSVTFIGVLSACSHVGLVDLGYYYFNLMSKEYRINPSKEHFGCMIDLLCRAGRLSDAEEMIKSMPFDRDDVVWSSLLRACRVKGDVERGKYAAEEILKLDPNCAGTYITLANIYASKGKWKESAEVRKKLRIKGIVKEPGWSWLKIKDRVSSFVAGDRSHEQIEDIYNILALIGLKTDISYEDLILSES